MDELKPCPFCGSLKIEMIKIDCTNEWFLRCEKCGIEQPLYNARSKAIKAWNRRKSDA